MARRREPAVNLEPEEPAVVRATMLGGPEHGQVVHLSTRFSRIHVNRRPYDQHIVVCNGVRYVGWFHAGLEAGAILDLANTFLGAPSSPAAGSLS